MSKFEEGRTKLAKSLENKVREVKEREIEPVRSIKSSKSQEVGNKNLKTVKLRIFPALENKLTPEGKRIRRELETLDEKEARKLKVKIALKHLEEQRKKGNLENGKKGENFEKHELPEINSILYGFEYNSKDVVLDK